MADEPPPSPGAHGTFHASLPARLVPRFIIQSGDKYYVTVGVWEYDPAAENMTSRQRQGVSQVKKDFNRLHHTAHGLTAVEIPEDIAVYSDPGAQTFGQTFE